MQLVDRAGLVSVWMVVLLVGGCARQDSPAPNSPATSPTSVPGTAAATPAADESKGAVPMVRIPAGQFVMGDDGGEEDEQPAHRVEVSAFYMDVHEVTQASFQAILGRNPSKSLGPDKPAERVNWLAAIQYCNLRSALDGLQPCYDLKTLACDFAADGYRLPTEAEWEYACRAATTTRWSCGDQAGDVGRVAWYKGNSGKSTHPVGQKPANSWGLCDLHGNVAEWCHDFYADHYEAGELTKDPRGPVTGTERVLRGGSWKSSEDACRCAARHSETPGFADACFGSEAYGFRCVRRAPADDGSP